jgi:hypothetical protein
MRAAVVPTGRIRTSGFSPLGGSAPPSPPQNPWWLSVWLRPPGVGLLVPCLVNV